MFQIDVFGYGYEVCFDSLQKVIFGVGIVLVEKVVVVIEIVEEIDEQRFDCVLIFGIESDLI